MALSWNLEDVENLDELYIKRKLPAHRKNDYEQQLRPFADLIIDYCGLIIGIPRITEDNWQEAYRRIHLWSTALGEEPIHEMTMEGRQSRRIKPEEVKRMIGTSTNGRSLDRDEFIDKLMDRVDEKAGVEDPDDLKLDERDEWFEALREEEKNQTEQEEAEV